MNTIKLNYPNNIHTTHIKPIHMTSLFTLYSIVKGLIMVLPEIIQDDDIFELKYDDIIDEWVLFHFSTKTNNDTPICYYNENLLQKSIIEQSSFICACLKKSRLELLY